MWECVFLHCYATGKIDYISNAELMSSPSAMARRPSLYPLIEDANTAFWIAAVPIFRGMHFYFAHRLIHVRVLYKYPFAGLAMHPIEHLYYYTCFAPCIYFRMSPLIMIWMGMHLLLSPAASHSGWEDHMQSDQFHYIHHAKFECNYGSASLPLDQWFGTFCDRMIGKGTYKGAAGHDNAAAQSKKPSPFKTTAPQGFHVYMGYSAALFAATTAAVLGYEPLASHPQGMAAMLAFSPILFGVLLRSVAIVMAATLTALKCNL
eukprot:gene8470-32727_t